MRKETRTRVIEEKYDEFIAEDGTSFNTESECVEYEKKKMQLVSKLHIEKLDGLVPLTDGLTSDGSEFYWYKVNNKDDFNTLNAYYEWKLDEPKEYPNILCLEVSEYCFGGNTGSDVWTYEFTDILDSVRKFLWKFNYKVNISDGDDN